MALIDPASQPLTGMAVAAVFLGFSAATQDIVIDAYRIESADNKLQAIMSASYIAGYRIGTHVNSGCWSTLYGRLFGINIGSVQLFGLKSTYMVMAATMLIGMATTLLISEPPPVWVMNQQV